MRRTLAGSGRRPISIPVLTAAVRASLREDPGLFQPVAAHFATEAALVAAYRELRDPSPAALDALAASGVRAADVIRLHRATRARLVPDWYDEEDLMVAAVDALSAREVEQVQEGIGAVVVYLPQRLSRATRLRCSPGWRQRRTSWSSPASPETSGPTPRSCRRRSGSVWSSRVIPVGPGRQQRSQQWLRRRTRFFTASDADEEVREAVRAVVDAAPRRHAARPCGHPARQPRAVRPPRP